MFSRLGPGAIDCRTPASHVLERAGGDQGYILVVMLTLVNPIRGPCFVGGGVVDVYNSEYVGAEKTNIRGVV